MAYEGVEDDKYCLGKGMFGVTFKALMYNINNPDY